MNNSPLKLCGPDITLRPVMIEDSVAIQRYRQLEQVARYQSWTTFDTAAAERLVSAQQGLEVDTPDSWYQLVIVDNNSGELAGDLVMHFLADDPRQAEVGFNLSPEYQDRGYATQALGCVLDYLFRELAKHRVTALTDADNLAAARLLERSGFRREGHFIENIWFKGRYGSEYLYAILAREWLAD
ncbi:N-acetyltransferase [Salmonella enterica subsp. enterica serovar Choleraesuis]|nr:N-acetyltransferase [Salmonella enterica subsp. enterica serovar Choleraesuis]